MKQTNQLQNYEEEDSDSVFEDDENSDEELQEALASGQLEPGLHGLVAFKRNELVNDVKGLKRKLKEFKLDGEWVERLDLVNEPAAVDADIEAQYGDMTIKTTKDGKISADEYLDKPHHDFKRELLFYRQSQAAVLEAIPRLHRLGVVTKRPDDYFAQMAKSDDHMKKVRENIDHRRNAIEASENARKLRELRKYGKKIQQEVLAKRQKEKREFLEKVKKVKKGQESLDFLDNSDRNKKKAGESKTMKRPESKRNQKRQYKTKKFGYGGQKKRSKYNSAESAADMSMFGKKKKGNLGKKNRPGKLRRKQIKGKK